MDVPVEKNKEYIVEIIDNGFNGEGIAKIDNYTIFVPNAIKGEKVKILVVKVLSSYAFGKIIQILEESNKRMEIDCTSYKRCGGCSLRHVQYETTLEMKRSAVQSLVDKNLIEKLCVDSVIGMEEPFFYRNKAQYPVGKNKDGRAVFGVFANRTHDIIEFDECKIQTKESYEIANVIIDFINRKNISVYDEEKCKGAFRHIIIKTGMSTDEIMCVFVLGESGFDEEIELVNLLIAKFSNIKTIVKNINTKNTNVILGEKNVVLYGNRIYSG